MSETHVAFILDMSGSMSNIKSATMEGTSAYIRTLREETPDARFSLTIFDTIIEEWITDERVSVLKPDKVIEKYKPRDLTALLDAIGVTVNSLRKRVKKEDKAVVVIMTDGYENASTEFTSDQINKLISKLTKKGNWTFVYLGANVDSFAVAKSLGVPTGNAAFYSNTGQSVNSVMASTAKSTSFRMSSPMAASADFFADAGEHADHKHVTLDPKTGLPIVNTYSNVVTTDTKVKS